MEDLGVAIFLIALGSANFYWGYKSAKDPVNLYEKSFAIGQALASINMKKWYHFYLQRGARAQRRVKN